MAESTLSVTFPELRKKVAYFLGYQRSFSDGTIDATDVAESVVTFNDTADGTRVWPTWAASGSIVYGGNRYTVKTRTSALQLILDGQPTAAPITAGTYELVPWDDRQFEDIDAAVENGLRRFYYPFIESEGQIYQWTFLRKNAQIALSNATGEYDLADDVAHVIENSVTYEVSLGHKPLTRVTEGQIRAMREESESGVPLYYAIRPKTHAPTTGQRFEMVVHPTPGVSEALENIDYRYVSAPNLLTTTNLYPLGGAMHSQTLIEACLAEAEKDMDDRSDVHEQTFQKLLLASYKADMEVREMESGGTTYDIDTVTYGTYQWLQQEVGLYAIQNANPDTFTVAEDKLVDSLIQSGVRQFYFPPILEGQDAPHKWSFLCNTKTITMVEAQQAYDLPATFGQVLGEFTWTAANATSRKIPIIQEERLLQLDSVEEATGEPKYAAVRVKTSIIPTAIQKWEVLLYPVPAAAQATLTLNFKMLEVPADMSATNLYPACGTLHAETMLASCLAVSETRKGEQGAAYSNFQQRLSSAIQIDKLALQETEQNTYTDTAVTYGTYQWLFQEVGRFMGYGGNANALTHVEEQDIDYIIQSGVNQFYFPPTLEGQTTPHKWSFLCPTTTVTLTSGDFDEDLAADFGQILGEFTWPTSSNDTNRVALIPVERLLQLRGEEGATGNPKWAAVRPKAATLTAVQAWEVLFYPEPDGGANGKALSYRYLKVPAAMSTTNLYPAGGTVHAETLLASCLAVAEIRKTGEMGSYTTQFMNRLSGSIQVDTQALGTTESETYADTEPTFGTLQWFRQEVGTSEYLKYGGNPNSWSESERREVDSIIQRGLKQFYVPPPMPGDGTRAHEWSFMTPEATITIWGNTEYTADASDPDSGNIITFATASQTVHQTMVGKTLEFETSENTYTIAAITEDEVYTVETMSGESASDTITIQADGNYLLPAAHGGFVEDSLSYDEEDDSYYSMKISSPARILELRQYNIGSVSPASRPLEAAYKPNAMTYEEQQRSILMVWPVPESDYTLHYLYHAIQPKLTDAKNYPMGTDMHAEAMLASCLAVAELKKTGRVGHEHHNFMRLLSASISRDRNQYRPKVYGRNLDHSDVPQGFRGRWYKSARYFDGTTYYGDE